MGVREGMGRGRERKGLPTNWSGPKGQWKSARKVPVKVFPLLLRRRHKKKKRKKKKRKKEKNPRGLEGGFWPEEPELAEAALEGRAGEEANRNRTDPNRTEQKPGESGRSIGEKEHTETILNPEIGPHASGEIEGEQRPAKLRTMLKKLTLELQSWQTVLTTESDAAKQSKVCSKKCTKHAEDSNLEQQ